MTSLSPHNSDDNSDRRVVSLLERARAGDQEAWSRLTECYDAMLRRIARSFRLSPADVDDVVQGTWLQLFVSVDGIREPAAVAGWLATTARRQSLKVLQRHAREQPTDDPDRGQSVEETPESLVLASERMEVVTRAISTLPAHQRRVISLIAAQPTLRYEQLGALLDMPVGSIGPTRARGLARLQLDPDLRALAAA